MGKPDSPPLRRGRKSALVTLQEIMRDIVPCYMGDPPHPDTVRDWLEAAKIPFMKANRRAKHGGGPKYYHARPVERFFLERSGLR